jgi:hypothetical protein
MPPARTDAHRSSSPASLSRSSISGTVRSKVVTTEYLLAQEHRRAGGGLSDVDDRHVEQLLQPLAAVLAVAGPWGFPSPVIRRHR